MAIDFTGVFESFESFGLYDVILPFILVFSLVFASLEKIKLFGDDKKNINLIFSLVVAFLAMRSEAFLSLIDRFLPNVAMLLVVILMFLLVFGVFAGEKKDWKRVPLVIGAVVSFIFIIFALFYDHISQRFEFPLWVEDLFYGLDDETKGIILFIGILVIIVWFLGWKKEEGGFGKMLKDFGEGLAGRDYTG